MSEYHGVYSSTGATRFKSSKDVQLDTVTGLFKPAGQSVSVRDRSFSTASGSNTRKALTAAELNNLEVNMAQLRLVPLSTTNNVPQKLREKAYVGFILTNLSESSSEKVEVVSLPGDSFTTYFFGRSPRTYAIQGILLNTYEDKWRDTFEELYEMHLRGTRLASTNTICQLKYDNRVITGWPIQMSMAVDSSSDIYSTFTMSILVSRVDKLNYNFDTSVEMYTRKTSDSAFGGKVPTLEDSRIASLTNIVRTGYTLPPPRPRTTSNGTGITGDCWNARPNNADSPMEQGANLQSTSIAESANCNIVAGLRDTAKRLEDKQRELFKAIESGSSEAEIQELRGTIKDLATDVELLQRDPRIKEAIGGEANGVVTLKSGRRIVTLAIDQSGSAQLLGIDGSRSKSSSAETNSSVTARAEQALAEARSKQIAKDLRYQEKARSARAAREAQEKIVRL